MLVKHLAVTPACRGSLHDLWAAQKSIQRAMADWAQAGCRTAYTADTSRGALAWWPRATHRHASEGSRHQPQACMHFCICMLKAGVCICVQVFADGEVVPGILLEEVQRRRQHLASSMPPDSIAVLPGAHMQYMSGVIPYRFRQEADFEYLTGIRQPDAVAVLECATRGRPCQQPTVQQCSCFALPPLGPRLGAFSVLTITATACQTCRLCLLQVASSLSSSRPTTER